MSKPDMQTAYNLPDFPPPPPRPSPRRRPIPLPLMSALPIPLPPNPKPLVVSPPSPPPASIERPFSQIWAPRQKYRRSPLGPQQLGAEKGPPISRRYVRPPPLKAASPCQAFTTPLMGKDQAAFKLYEEWVSKSLERRIRDKVRRSSKLGEKAGLGVNAGREMLIWSVLGNLRETQYDNAMTASLSAPPTQMTFPSFPMPPELTGHTTDARLARSLGHRKTMSLATYPSSPSRPGGLAALGKIRHLITTRLSSEIPPTLKGNVAAEAEVMRRIVQEHLGEGKFVQDFTDEIKSEFDDSSESSGSEEEGEEEEEEEEEEEVEVKVVLVNQPRSPSPITEIHLESPRPLPSLDKPLPEIVILSCLSKEPTHRARSRSRSPPELPHAKRAAVVPSYNSDEPLPSVRPPPLAYLAQSPAPAFLHRSTTPSSTSQGFRSRFPPISSPRIASTPHEPFSTSSQSSRPLSPPRHLKGRYTLLRPVMPVATARQVSASREMGEENEGWSTSPPKSRWQGW